MPAAAQLVDSVDDSFDHAGTVTDPTKMRHHLCGKSGQKRRYDEDFKRAVSSEIIVKKRAVSITFFRKNVPAAGDHSMSVSVVKVFNVAQK